MPSDFQIPELKLTPEHLKSVRLYLSSLYDMPKPISQADIATLFGCTNKNSYAKWERQENTPLPMLLRFMQLQIHEEHRRRGLFKTEAQSLDLFFHFHEALASPTPPVALISTGQSDMETKRNRLLHDVAWVFGPAFMADGFRWWLLDDPLTIYPAFGGRNLLRTPYIFLIDQMVRNDGEPGMTPSKTNYLREQLKSLRPDFQDDEAKTIAFDHFDVQLKGGTLAFLFREQERHQLLKKRFIDAGRQGELDMTPLASDKDVVRLGRHVLARCSCDQNIGVVKMHHFIGTDLRCKFIQLTQMEAAFQVLGGKPVTNAEKSLGHKMWAALRKGENELETDLFDLTLERRELLIRVRGDAFKILPKLNQSKG